MKSVIGALLVMLVACKTPNPDACCTSIDDCKAFGLDDIQPCDTGLTCVGHQCVAPQCSTQGCAAEAPICDTTTDTCTGCDDSTDCARFSGTDVCDTATGGCVECVGPSDCSSGKPICEAHACRGCKLDSECVSGACADDGSCVAETGVVYLSPVGTDIGLCTRDAPCHGLRFGASVTSMSRSHIVMATGRYSSPGEIIDSSVTTTEPIVVHGGGATVAASSETGPLFVRIGATLRDLELVGGGGVALGLGGLKPILVERLKISGLTFAAIDVSPQVTMRDVSIVNTHVGIRVGTNGRVVLDRGIISGGDFAIQTQDLTSMVDISNLLVFGTADVALDLQTSAGGAIRFTTIADAGTDAGSGPRALTCPSSNLAVSSSIIWAPGTVARPAIGTGCSTASTIVGPTPVAGTINADPKFVDPATRNYHLAAGSPARDAAETGPALDFEGDPRPRGARFDIGADEAP